MTHELGPLPEPFDYCYEWDGPYGTRKFSVAPHNGRKPDRSVPIYRADQLRAYALAEVQKAVLAERERCADGLRQQLRSAGRDGLMQAASLVEGLVHDFDSPDARAALVDAAKMLRAEARK